MRLLPYCLLGLVAIACQKPVSEPAPAVSSAYYYPPQTGDAWETVSPAQLKWNTAKLNDAIAYAQQRSTYGLIILHKGRIVTAKILEQLDGHDPLPHRVGGEKRGRDARWHRPNREKALNQ